MREDIDFDFNDILTEFRSGKKLTGKGGLLESCVRSFRG
jgi:hypothetical protein